MRERERGRKRVDDVDVNATSAAFGARSLATWILLTETYNYLKEIKKLYTLSNY